MRAICRICMRKITENRTSHLKRHGIDSDYKGAIVDYFLTPQELGISELEFQRIPEGAKVTFTRGR
ncbi:MAG: hypothetical protein QXQ50_09285 [Candidatus Bathyarchaeia archaeon]